MSIEEWDVPQELLNSLAVKNRDQLAVKYSTAHFDEILPLYISMTRDSIRKYFHGVFDLFPSLQFQNVGLEIGAGVGAFSCIACERFPEIEKIYSVEVAPEVVRRLQSITIPALNGKADGRVVSVIGTFDDIKLPASSVDFCLEIGALHHSDNLKKTLAEVARVLKPGGLFLAIDHTNENCLSEEQREFMLDVEYPEEWKRLFGYDDAPLKRRDNGEHEIKLNEWVEAFETSGFEIQKTLMLRTTGFLKLLRGTMLSLPFQLRQRLNMLPSRSRWHNGEWWWLFKYMLGLSRSDNKFKAMPKGSYPDNTLFLLKRV